MIKSFDCTNFKSLMKFEIKFRTPLTVIAGPNGSGKTTICQALATAGRLVSESPQIVMDELSQNDWDLIKNKWERTNLPYFLTTFDDDTLYSMWTIILKKHDKWEILYESVSSMNKTDDKPHFTKELIREKNHISLKLFDPGTGEWEDKEEIKNLPSYLSTIVEETKHQHPGMWFTKENMKVKYIPFLDPVELRRKTNQPVLGDTGKNFAYFLMDFKRKNPELFKIIVAKVKEFFPQLEDIMTTSTKFGWTEVRAKIKPSPEDDNAIFRSWQINDGLLRLLALATLPYSDPDLKMLIFEEPENGIHPKLIGATVELLRSLENIQVVLTTHSPLLLNYMKPEEVVVLVPQGKSGPVAIPFTELDKAEERLKYFDIGDILFHEDEWELAKPYLKKLKEKQGSEDKKAK